MYKEDINSKHFSLGIIFSLFILVMSSFVVSMLMNEKSLQNESEKVGYEHIDYINPLILENSKQVIDKTNNNIEIVEEIERVYNIEVMYGDGTEYLAKTVEAEAIYNSDDINGILLQIVDCLDKYPTNIFKEMELNDYTIEICLVDYFNNDNLALATRDSNNNFRIYLSDNENSNKIERAVHHETYHILEYYIKLEYDINELYKEWNTYNPEGFSYQEDITMLDTSYVYSLDNKSEAYFVSAYSKVSDKEDRAEVFADTMIADNIPTYYTDNVGALRGKIELISEVLKHCFYTVEYSRAVYWTRYF